MPTEVHTRVRVAFHTHEEDGFSADEPITSDPRLGFIIACSTSKQKGACAGTWSLTIKRGDGFGPVDPQDDLWRDPENVWVEIFIERDGQRYDTMLGLIDSISASMQRTGSGQRTETYQITGRDFGKTLEETQLWVNYFAQPDNPVRSAGAIARKADQNQLGSPGFFVKFLLDEWLGNAGAAERQWRLPPGLRSFGGVDGASRFFFDKLEQRISTLDSKVHGETVAPTLFQVDQTSGKLWDSLTEYANTTMNELFVDLAPPPGVRDTAVEGLVPTLVHRQYPFPRHEDAASKTQWQSLRTHVLNPGEIVTRNVSKGGAGQRFNYWVVLFEGLGTESFNVQEILQEGLEGVEYGRPGNIPIFNQDSIQKHGVKRYAASTRYLPYFEARREGVQPDKIDVLRLAGEWLKRVHDWYAIAPWQLSGQIGLRRVHPEIRIGHRVVERRPGGREITYYVEQVDHQWSYPGSGFTSLTVTRGEYDDADLLAAYYETYEIVESDDTVDINVLLAEIASGTQGAPGRRVVGEIEPEPEPDVARVQGDEADEQAGREFTKRDGSVDPEPTVGEQGGEAVPPPAEGEPPPADFEGVADTPAAEPEPRTPDNPLPRRNLERVEPIDLPPDTNDPIAGLEGVDE